MDSGRSKTASGRVNRRLNQRVNWRIGEGKKEIFPLQSIAKKRNWQCNIFLHNVPVILTNSRPKTGSCWRALSCSLHPCQMEFHQTPCLGKTCWGFRALQSKTEDSSRALGIWVFLVLHKGQKTWAQVLFSWWLQQQLVNLEQGMQYGFKTHG